ncbi:MAG: right-handed parallel beta-helix repeat-containing protein [Parvularculaceae bacterium]
MKKATILRASVAMGALAAAIGASAAAQTIGGFPVSRDTQRTTAPRAVDDYTRNSRNEVTVSQSPLSKYNSIEQAMSVVRPGGTIYVRGGERPYGSFNVYKPVSIVGVEGDYGRPPIVAAPAGAPCATIYPEGATAAVRIEKISFQFDIGQRGSRGARNACVDISGGSVEIVDTYIGPTNTDLPLNASFGVQSRGYPDLDRYARPARDPSPHAQLYKRIEQYFAQHTQPVGARSQRFDVAKSGASLPTYLRADAGHARSVNALYPDQEVWAAHPTAGVRISAGSLNLKDNIITGAETAVMFESANLARVNGDVSNNFLLGNRDGVVAVGGNGDDNLLIEGNTIQHNTANAIYVDMPTGVDIVTNLIVGNKEAIEFSPKVRRGSINANFIAGNVGTAIKAYTGFAGAVTGNTIAENGECTMMFLSEQAEVINNAKVILPAFRAFNPTVTFERSNVIANNGLDAKRPRRAKKRRYFEGQEPIRNPIEVALPACKIENGDPAAQRHVKRDAKRVFSAR